MMLHGDVVHGNPDEPDKERLLNDQEFAYAWDGKPVTEDGSQYHRYRLVSHEL